MRHLSNLCVTSPPSGRSLGTSDDVRRGTNKTHDHVQTTAGCLFKSSFTRRLNSELPCCFVHSIIDYYFSFFHNKMPPCGEGGTGSLLSMDTDCSFCISTLHNSSKGNSAGQEEEVKSASVWGVAAAAAAPSALETSLLTNVIEFPERTRNKKRKFIKQRRQKRKLFDKGAKLAQGLPLVAIKGKTKQNLYVLHAKLLETKLFLQPNLTSRIYGKITYMAWCAFTCVRQLRPQ